MADVADVIGTHKLRRRVRHVNDVLVGNDVGCKEKHFMRLVGAVTKADVTDHPDGKVQILTHVGHGEVHCPGNGSRAF